MRHSRKLFLVLASLIFIHSVTPPTLIGRTKSSRPPQITLPRATCYCKISKDDLWSKTSATGVLMDLTDEVDTTYGTQSENNQQECQSFCKTKAAHHFHDFTIASSACAAGVPNGTRIQAFSAVGKKGYRAAIEIGILASGGSSVTQTSCTCPPTWTCNACSPQVAGGKTTDGKCKKVACEGNAIPPYPPDGTPIGSWGFTWGNYFVAWGTTANGGAPDPTSCVTTVVQYGGGCGWH
jgi:hypothetical protein